MVSERERLLKLCAEGDHGALEALRRLNERLGLDERYETFCGPLKKTLSWLEDDERCRTMVVEMGESLAEAEALLMIPTERLDELVQAEAMRRGLSLAFEDGLMRGLVGTVANLESDLMGLDTHATQVPCPQRKQKSPHQRFLDTKREPWRNKRGRR